MPQLGQTDSFFDQDVRPYIEFEGEVEIRWSHGAIEDLLHYMDHNKEFKDYNGEFDPNMRKKDPYCSLPQSVLWCRACSCKQKQMGMLHNYIKGKKHINKTYEFRR